MRPRTQVTLLVAGCLFAIVIWKLNKALIGFLASQNPTAAFAPHPMSSMTAPSTEASTPWTREPVTEPILAGTLFRGLTVKYYDISGDTPDQLEASLSALGPGSIGAEAKTSYHLVLFKGNPSDGNCGFTNASVSADISLWMPRWVVMPNVTDRAKQWWSYKIKELAAQQQAHIFQAMKEAQQATFEIRRSNCNTGDTVYTDINNRLTSAHLPAVYPAEGADIDFQTPGAIAVAASNNSPTVARLPTAPNNFQALDSGTFSYNLTGADGSQVSLQNQRGHVLFLNFWATWCGPCRDEMPSLAALYSRLRGSNIFFGCITNETMNKVGAYKYSTHLDVPIYMVTPGANLPVQAYPTTLVVSKKGEVVMRRVGSARWDTPEMEKFLTDLDRE